MKQSLPTLKDVVFNDGGGVISPEGITGEDLKTVMSKKGCKGSKKKKKGSK